MSVKERISSRIVIILLLVAAAFFVSAVVENADALTRTGFGSTLRLTGNGDAATATTGGDLDITGDITLECWFYTKSSDSANISNTPLIFKSGSYFLRLEWASATSAVVTARYIVTAGNQDTISTAQTISQDVWHHIAFVRNGTTGTIYIDGVEVKQQTGLSADTIVTASTVLNVGSNASSNKFIGIIDDVKISAVAQYTSASFTPENILPDDVNTKALYHFDEANGSTSFDDSAANDSVTDTLTASGSTVTDVKLSYFKAIPKGNKIVLKWKTDSETSNAGFNILRSDSKNGNYVMINNETIASTANDAIGGGKYSYDDTDVEIGKKYFYKLVDIEIDNTENINAPNPKAKIKEKNKRQKKHKKQGK